MAGLLDEIRDEIARGAGKDYVASRGEYLTGRVLADVLGAVFIDPASAIKFRSDGRLDEQSYALLKDELAGDGCFVIPGFYVASTSGISPKRGFK